MMYTTHTQHDNSTETPAEKIPEKNISVINVRKQKNRNNN